MNVETLLLTTAAASLRLHTERIGICLAKLTPDQIWARGNENENAAGNLVLHLAGNVRQWIISGLGGAPDLRLRDREFAFDNSLAAEALNTLLEGTTTEAIAVLSGLSSEQLLRTYTIQNRTSTGVEAVLRVTEHFALHTGQIIYATKNLTGHDLGLTMPRAK